MTAQQEQVGWYYTSQGQQVGPVDAEHVRRAVAAGQVYGTDMAWREGMASWVPLSTVPELWPAGGTGGVPLGYGVMNYATPGVAYAGFWLRFVAYIIDYIIVYAASFVAGFVLGFVLGAVIAGAGGSQEAVKVTSAIAGGVAGFVIGWLYYAMMESSAKQATLGKMALGLRVTDEQGGRITFGKATGRFFGKIVSGLILSIGFMMAGWTQKKQALHDIMAGTLVVRGADRR